MEKVKIMQQLPQVQLRTKNSNMHLLPLLYAHGILQMALGFEPASESSAHAQPESKRRHSFLASLE